MSLVYFSSAGSKASGLEMLSIGGDTAVCSSALLDSCQLVPANVLPYIPSICRLRSERTVSAEREVAGNLLCPRATPW